MDVFTTLLAPHNLQSVPVSCQNHLHGLGLADCSDQSLGSTHAWNHSQLDLWLQQENPVLSTNQGTVQSLPDNLLHGETLAFVLVTLVDGVHFWVARVHQKNLQKI